MKIAIGGMQKNQMQQEVAKACPDVETVVTNDMNAASLLDITNAVQFVKTVVIQKKKRSKGLYLREKYVLE